MAVIGFSGMELSDMNVELFKHREDGVYYYEDILYQVKFPKDAGKILNFDEPEKPQDPEDFDAKWEYKMKFERYAKHAENYEDAVISLKIKKICNLRLTIESYSLKQVRGKENYIYNCLVKFHHRPEMEIQLDPKDFATARQLSTALMSKTPGGCFTGTNKDMDMFRDLLFEDMEKLPCK